MNAVTFTCTGNQNMVYFKAKGELSKCYYKIILTCMLKIAMGNKSLLYVPLRTALLLKTQNNRAKVFTFVRH